MPDAPVFTVDQVAEANTAMRTALGLPPEHVSLDQFLSMLGDEIAQLRAKGWGDTEIAALLSESTGSVVPPDAVAQVTVPPDRAPGRP
jgi:hypothetical protein